MTTPDMPPGWQPPPQQGQPDPGWQPPRPQGQPDASWQPAPSWDAPSDHTPPGYAPPNYAPPNYAPPNYAPPNYAPPNDAPPNYAPPGYPDYAGNQVPLMPPPAKKSRRGRVLVASAAVAAVAAGGVATYVAVSASSSTGSGSARKAVQQLATDLGRSDLVGVLNDLPPNERTAIAGPFTQTIKELQRNQVVQSGANLHKVGGVSFSAQHLTFAAKTVSIGAHVQVVQVTGGTLRVSADVAELPLTAAFFKAAAHDGQVPHGSSTRTVDIGRAVRASGKPVRIAVQQVGSNWYPSLTYTIADYAAAENGLPAPTAAQAVPARGESSADDAVSTMITSLVRGDVRRAIELVSPDELPVLHDYGTLITSHARYPAAPIQLTNIRFKDTAGSGGTDVGIRSLEVTAPNMTVKVDLTGSCPVATINGQTKRFCAAQLLDQVSGGFGVHLTAAQQQAFTDLFAGLTDQRFHTSQVDGQWYVDPVQTYAEQLPRLLSHLRGDDLLQLIAYSNQH